MQGEETAKRPGACCQIIDIGSREHGKLQAKARGIDERSQRTILIHMIGYLEASKDLISSGRQARPDEISRTFSVMEDMINEEMSNMAEDRRKQLPPGISIRKDGGEIKRTIPLLPEITKRLRRHKVEQAKLRMMLGDMWKSVRGLEHLVFTTMFGKPPKVVQSYLGHSTIDVTMNIYTHVTAELEREEIRKLANQF